MPRKTTVIVFLAVLVIGLSASAFAQAGGKKEARVEGRVTHINTEKQILTVQASDQRTRPTVTYDASTKWQSAYHDKTPTPIEAKDVIVGDQVICVGTTDDKGNIHATLISKRLSHPNNP